MTLKAIIWDMGGVLLRIGNEEPRLNLAKEYRIPLETIYQAGIQNITIDLMYDLPNQTLDSWEMSLKIACHLPITHLSLYNLTIEPESGYRRETSAVYVSQIKRPDIMSIERFYNRFEFSVKT